MSHRLSVDRGDTSNGIHPVPIVAGFTRTIKQRESDGTIAERAIPVIIDRFTLDTPEEVQNHLTKRLSCTIDASRTALFDVIVAREEAAEQVTMILRMAGYEVFESEPPILIKPESTVEQKPTSIPQAA